MLHARFWALAHLIHVQHCRVGLGIVKRSIGDGGRVKQGVVEPLQKGPGGRRERLEAFQSFHGAGEEEP